MVHDAELGEAGVLGGHGDPGEILGERRRPAGPGEVRHVQSEPHALPLVVAYDASAGHCAAVTKPPCTVAVSAVAPSGRSHSS